MSVIESPSIFDRLTFRKNGFVVVKPCLDVTVHWSGSVFERVEDVLEFYRQSLNAHAGRFRYYRTETMSEFRSLKKDTLQLLPFWLRGTASRRDIYMLFLESGSVPGEPSDRAFAFNATPARGYMRLMLPTELIADSVESYVDLAKNLGLTSSYDFGSGGFAVNWNFPGGDTRSVLRAMNSVAHRYPGIDMSHPFSTKYIASKGIKCVNWLTYLSAEYCSRLGGVASLRKKFDRGVVVHDAEGSVMIQAGPEPEIGDVNRQMNLPVYRQVGREVSSVRCREHPPLFGYDGFADEETTERWLSRFDR